MMITRPMKSGWVGLVFELSGPFGFLLFEEPFEYSQRSARGLEDCFGGEIDALPVPLHRRYSIF